MILKCFCFPTLVKKKGKEKPKVNLILSHVNHTFLHSLYWTLELDPKPLNTFIVYLRKKFFFFNLKKGLVQDSIWSLGFWCLDPHLKWP
jgi:hypothetical protein